MQYTEIFLNNDKQFLIKNIFNAKTHITFSIKIKSGEFADTSSYCIAKDDIKILVLNLYKMYNTLNGQIEINDYDSGAFIVLNMATLGHMNISGQIGGSHENHFLKFEFMSDQTAVLNLKNYFNNIILD